MFFSIKPTYLLTKQKLSDSREANTTNNRRVSHISSYKSRHMLINNYNSTADDNSVGKAIAAAAAFNTGNTVPQSTEQMHMQTAMQLQSY